jgi:Flp pilus assembly protein TadD
MMNLAPEYRRNMPQFVDLVAAGIPAELAFEKAFSRSLEQGLHDAARWIRQPRMPVLSLVWRPPSAVEIEAEPLREDEAEVAQIELLLRAGRHAAAANRLRRLERTHSKFPPVVSALAMFAMGAGNKQEALNKFESAIQLGDLSASTYFEYAMLLRDTGAPREKVRALLSEAVGRNPKHAEAHFILGLMAQQDGDLRAAAAGFEQAVEVLPGQSYFWHALAMTYHSLKRSTEARLAARRAVATAGTAEQREMAHAVLRLTSSAHQGEPAPPVPPTVAPKGWEMPKGDAQVEGILEHIDCLGAHARFHIRVAGRSVVLYVENPGQVLLKTPSALTFEFSCGAQKPRRVMVEYRRNPNPGRRTEGDITAIDFP